MKTRASAPTATPELYETQNDISKEDRAELVTLMNQRLADAVDLQMQNEASALGMSKGRISSDCMNCLTRLMKRWSRMWI